MRCILRVSRIIWKAERFCRLIRQVICRSHGIIDHKYVTIGKHAAVARRKRHQHKIHHTNIIKDTSNEQSHGIILTKLVEDRASQSVSSTVHDTSAFSTGMARFPKAYSRKALNFLHNIQRDIRPLSCQCK